MAWILPVALLMGCASTTTTTVPPAFKDTSVISKPVSGPETPEDRTTIKQSTDQIYNTEHTGDPGVPVPPAAPNTGIP